MDCAVVCKLVMSSHGGGVCVCVCVCCACVCVCVCEPVISVNTKSQQYHTGATYLHVIVFPQSRSRRAIRAQSTCDSDIVRCQECTFKM